MKNTFWIKTTTIQGTTVISVYENLLSSVISDVMTALVIIFCFTCFYINYKYCVGGLLLNLLCLMLSFVVIFKRTILGYIIIKTLTKNGVQDFQDFIDKDKI